MASDEILVCRLVTGEDVIGKITEGSKTITIIKGFVIIPTQSAKGQPIQLMLTPYAPYSDGDSIEIRADKVMSITKPKEQIKQNYITNTSSILAPKKQLITETGLPSLDK
jgi:hypothetical protein|tara:strand:- start:349 stop:678 length:330 start_codon:yes stop_codon:yes gene_type:complete